jgi:probable HAF family extracellular repeat protein
VAVQLRVMPLEDRCLLNGYSILDLGGLGDGGGIAYAINHQGDATGIATVTGGQQNHAFLYSKGTMTDLGTLGGTYSEGLAMNNGDQIVGDAKNSAAQDHAFLWQTGVMSDLGTLGGTFSAAEAINSSGQIVGEANTTGDKHTYAFLYSAGTMTQLATLGGTFGSADGINDAGLIVGTSTIAGNSANHAFKYSNGVITDLGTLGGANSSANAVNNNGQIVGAANTTNNTRDDAFLYSGGVMTDLGTLGGLNSVAYGIDDSGDIVGESTLAGEKVTDAFIYSHGVMTDLTAQIAGASSFTHLHVQGINDFGQIVGYAVGADKNIHAVMLSPTPANLVVAGFPALVTSGTAGSITVTVQDANGDVVPSYSGTVHFTSSDPAAELPADYTFTSGDAGVHTFSVKLMTAGSQSITVTDTVSSSITGTQSAILIDPASFTVSGFASPTTAGVVHSFTVTAENANGTTATGYVGTVAFTSTDLHAALPGTYTFTASDAGVHTFQAALKTAGIRSMSVADAITPAVTGTQSGIRVLPAAVSRFLITASASTVAGTAFSFTVAAKDAYGNTVPAYTGTVTFISGDKQAVLPANYTFTQDDKGIHSFTATLKSAGTRSLTAQDTVSTTVKGTKAITVTAAAASRLRVVIPSTVTAGQAFTITVTALDSYGNVATGYTGTIHFTTSDRATGVVLPADYTFTASDAGKHVFTNTVTLETVGTQTITVTDAAAGTIRGSAKTTVDAPTPDWANPFALPLRPTGTVAGFTGKRGCQYG